VFLDVLPATVISLSARVGVPVGGGDGGNGGDGSDGALAVLATAGLRVESLVSPSDVELLTEGMDVELRDDISGDSLPATLATLGDQVVTSDDGSDRGFRAIIETDDPIPREWTGRNVRVTFTGAETATAVLVVPVAALSSSADGGARVEVVGADAVVTTVPVEAGLSADGFVEVTPLDGAALHEGDLVVVGSNGAGTG
jgi:multidrug efflux pump subunit AcrA (membrane-fusion protein)